jgi:hypothetical protein
MITSFSKLKSLINILISLIILLEDNFGSQLSEKIISLVENFHDSVVFDISDHLNVGFPILILQYLDSLLCLFIICLLFLLFHQFIFLFGCSGNFFNIFAHFFMEIQEFLLVKLKLFDELLVFLLLFLLLFLSYIQFKFLSVLYYDKNRESNF